MGRSYLSVKLAFAFGLCIGVLVLVADRAMAGGRGVSPPAAERPVLVPAASAVPPAPELTTEPCLWRGCPMLLQPYRRTAERLPRGLRAHRAT
ncbi:MAG TPA: hypothetical protein VK929_02590 [Longimicrobiales bacterium]|nr:hypothetical protein [Longimicrobiales bacterium]